MIPRIEYLDGPLGADPPSSEELPAHQVVSDLIRLQGPEALMDCYKNVLKVNRYRSFHKPNPNLEWKINTGLSYYLRVMQML